MLVKKRHNAQRLQEVTLTPQHAPSHPPFHFQSSLIFLTVASHTPIYMGKHLHALRHSLWYTQMHICTHKYPVVPSLPPVVFLASVCVSSVWGHLTRTFLSYPLLLCSPGWNRLGLDITISTNLFNCKLNSGQTFKQSNVARSNVFIGSLCSFY